MMSLEEIEIPEERTAISDVDFTLRRGEMVAVIGEVGSGKSSLLATVMKETIHLRG